MTCTSFLTRLCVYCAEKQAIRPLPGVSQAIPGGPYLRKAPCQFGWDWGPQLPPIGIWKDIRLEGYEAAAHRGSPIQPGTFGRQGHQWKRK